MALNAGLSGLFGLVAVISFILRSEAERATVSNEYYTTLAESAPFTWIFYLSYLGYALFSLGIVSYFKTKIDDTDGLGSFIHNLGLLGFGGLFFWMATIFGNARHISEVYLTASTEAKEVYVTYGTWIFDPMSFFYICMVLWFVAVNYYLLQEESASNILAIIGFIVASGNLAVFLSVYLDNGVLRLFAAVGLITMGIWSLWIAKYINDAS